MIDKLFEKVVEFLSQSIKTEGVIALGFCLCIIYIWYLRNSKKLQEEHKKILIEQFQLKSLREEKIAQFFKNRPKRNTSKNITQKRILVVDDDADMREVIEAIILDYNNTIEVGFSPNGLDALQKILRDPPALLITDIKMPKMSGIELLQQLHENKINISTVIMYSGFNIQEVISKIENLNLAKIDILEKPFDPAELQFFIKKYLSD